MKFLQMLKWTKLRKMLSRKPRVTEKVGGAGVMEVPHPQSTEDFLADLTRKDRIGRALSDIMQDYAETRGPMNPIPSYKGVGISLSQLATFPPTQVRNLVKCFGRSVDELGRRSGYSVRTLEAILVEFGGETVGFSPICRKTDPTVLITKRSGYKRKVDGKYTQNHDPRTVINSWS